MSPLTVCDRRPRDGNKGCVHQVAQPQLSGGGAVRTTMEDPVDDRGRDWDVDVSEVQADEVQHLRVECENRRAVRANLAATLETLQAQLADAVTSESDSGDVTCASGSSDGRCARRRLEAARILVASCQRVLSPHAQEIFGVSVGDVCDDDYTSSFSPRTSMVARFIDDGKLP